MEGFSGHESTSLSTYLRVLRRRGWIVVVCAVIAPAVAYVLSSRQTSLYVSTAEVIMNKENLGANLTGIDTVWFDEVRALDTQASLATVPDVAARALEVAGLDDRSPFQLLGQTTVTPKGATDILVFQVVDASPATAQLLASSYAVGYTRYRADLETKAVARAREEVQQALASLVTQGRTRTPLYNTLQEKQQQLQTLQTLQTARAQVIRTAGPGVQIGPHPKRDAAIAIALGLVLGLGLAFAAEALDTRIRSTGELGERLGGLALLSRIPEPPKKLQKADELVMVSQPTGPAAEAFRVLRTNLEFVRLAAGDVRTILLTSAVEQEGKSTTSANLAVALARSGKRVALVDLDLRRPYIDRFFKLLHSKGITDVALGNATLGEALVRIDLGTGRTATPGDKLGGQANGGLETGVLDVLTTGPLPPDPGEFVGSATATQILGRLREAYDVVVIDSPPVLRVGDALTLSTKADGVIVVARLSILRRPVLKELRRVLEAAPAPKLGFVVTGSEGGEAYSAMYGGGYGYGDSYYTREADRVRANGGGSKAEEGAKAAREGTVR